MRASLRAAMMGGWVLLGVFFLEPPVVASALPEKPARAAPSPGGADQAGGGLTAPPKAAGEAGSSEYRLSHDRYVKAIAYSRSGYALYFASFVVLALSLVLILQLGLAAKLRAFAEKCSDQRWVQSLVFVPLLLLLVDAVNLPISVYWHRLSLGYQQSVQRWGSWLEDWMKAELLKIAFAVLLALILFAIMRSSPRRWWIYFWFPAVLVLAFAILISPLVIDPLFNSFEPLSLNHSSLVASMEALTRHGGSPVPPERMFLMQASRKTNAVNAYVTGLGSSKRVVLWDTTIQKLSEPETLSIVGHELGHYELGHVQKGLLAGAAGIFIALFLLYRGLHGCLARWSEAWKISSQEDLAALAVLLLLLHLLQFVASPVVNGFSRAQEHAADVYGLELIHGVLPNSNRVAAEAFQRLGELDLSDPNPPPLVRFWLYSHPPLAERLVFAYSYDPWSKGEEPSYVK